MDVLCLLEFCTLPRGMRALDALVKEAAVTVVEANLVEPGRYLVLFGGEVEACTYAFAKAKEVGGSSVLDAVLLPFAHPRLWALLQTSAESLEAPDTLGVVESDTLATLVAAADRAAKAAEVTLSALRLAPALGGKGYFLLHGLQHDVEAALAAAQEEAGRRGRALRVESIPRPHPEFLAHLLVGAPFGVAGRASTLGGR